MRKSRNFDISYNSKMQTSNYDKNGNYDIET